MKKILLASFVMLNCFGQPTQPAAVNPQVPPAPKAVALSITGTIVDGNKAPVEKARVMLDSGAVKILGESDAKGAFTFDKLEPIKYTVTIEAKGFAKQSIESTAPATVCFSLLPECCQVSAKRDHIWWITGLLGIYYVIVLLARYNNIATVNRNILRAQIKSVEQRVAAIREPERARAEALIHEAEKMCESGSNEIVRTFLFWTRGQELSAWMLLHEADLIISSTYNLDQTIARLQIAIAELLPDYKTVADIVKAALDDLPNRTLERLQPILNNALQSIYSGRDSSFELIFSWQNKAFTLLGLGLCVLAAIVQTNDNAWLVLMGLSGGLVSRLMRSATGTEIPRDYGANWTTLFLSPVFGAFAGWFGVLMMVASKDLKLLGEIFSSLSWCDAGGKPLPLALAFLFGFSERLFSTVTDSLQKATTDALNKTVADPPGTGTATGNLPGSIGATPAFTITKVDVNPPVGITITGTGLDKIGTLSLRKDTDEVPLSKSGNSTATLLTATALKIPPNTYILLVDSKPTTFTVTFP